MNNVVIGIMILNFIGANCNRLSFGTLYADQ